MPWDTTRPANDDLVSGLPTQWQQTKSDLQTYLQSMVYWVDSADSTGWPQYSATTGKWVTGRIIAAPRSEVSSRNRVDLFYVTDEERLVYMDASGNSVVVGGPRAVISLHTLGGSQRNLPLMAENCRTVICSGSATTTNDNVLTTQITYGVTYNAPPLVWVGSGSTTTQGDSSASYVVAASNIGTSGCSLSAQYVKASTGTINNLEWYWRSIGTVTL